MSAAISIPAAWFNTHSGRLFDRLGVPGGTSAADRLRREAAQRIVRGLSGERDPEKEGGRGMFRSRFIDELLSPAEHAGIAPRRIADELGVIWNLSTLLSFGFQNWAAGFDSDIREAFPASRVVTSTGRLTTAFRQRWKAAGGEIIKGEAVAPREHPAWLAVSDFGVPWPPFHRKCELDVEDVSAKEARELGLTPGLAVMDADWWSCYNEPD